MRVLFIVLCLLLSGKSYGTESIDVLALEYPPFTTLNKRSGGIAFELLRRRTEGRAVIWKPFIVPPARAAQMMDNGEWCASFFPAVDKRNTRTVSLAEEIVKVGLVRLAGNSDFTWRQLDELSPKSVALLRTGSNSSLSGQFIDAGLAVVYVDSITAAVQMVLRERTQYALFDSVSFASLETHTRRRLQMSETSLIETPVTVLLNNACQLDGFFTQ